MSEGKIVAEAASTVYESIIRYSMDISLDEFDELVQGAMETLEHSRAYVKNTPSHRRTLD